LSSRAANGSPLASIEHAKLDTSGIGRAAHHAIQRIDFPNKVALAKPTYRRIARHDPDGVTPEGKERCARTTASGCGRCLAACVPATDDYDIEGVLHGGDVLPFVRRVKRFALFGD